MEGSSTTGGSTPPNSLQGYSALPTTTTRARLMPQPFASNPLTPLLRFLTQLCRLPSGHGLQPRHLGAARDQPQPPHSTIPRMPTLHLPASRPTWPRAATQFTSNPIPPDMHAPHSLLQDSSAQHSAVFEPLQNLTAGVSDRATAPALSLSSSPRRTRTISVSHHHHSLPGRAPTWQKVSDTRPQG